MKNKLLLILFVLSTIFSFGQSKEVPNYQSQILNSGNYYSITEAVKPLLLQNLKNANTSSEIRSANKALKRFGKWQYSWKDRIDENGNFTQSGGVDFLSNLSPNTTFNTSSSNTQSNASVTPSWQQVGPITRVLPHGRPNYPGQGLVTNITLIPGGNAALVGTNNGGIWKTDDFTVENPNWIAKTDFLARLGIVNIKINTANSNIFALTGDRDRTNGFSTATIGVITSTDTGENWATTSLVLDPTQVQYISNLGMKPNDNNKMFFATNTGTKNTNPLEGGLVEGFKQYATTDGWATHQVYENELQHLNDVLYTNDFILVSDILGRIYKSVDDGATWVNIYNNNGGATDGVVVIRFNQSHNSGDVYFVTAAKNNAIVYKLTTTEILNATAPISATQVGNPLTTFNPQQIYNVAFAVSAADNNRMFLLGVDGYYTKDGGANWALKIDSWQTSGGPTDETYVHPDHHYISHVSGSEWISTNDGGVGTIDMSSFDNGNGNEIAIAVDKTNNLQIGQIYHSAIYPSDTTFSNAVLGIQDNNSMSKSPNTQDGAWVSVGVSDGTSAAIHPSNPLIRLVGAQNGQLLKTTTAAQSGYNDGYEVLPSNTDAAFFCKAIFHNTNGNLALATYDEVMASTDAGDTWDYLPEFDGLGETQEIEVWDTKIAVVGINGQKCANIDVGSFEISNVQDINQPTGVSSNFNSLCVNSATANVFYGSISGYNSGNKVFKSTDNGVSWSNISYNLPNVVIRKVLNKVTNIGTFDEILFVGTEIGVYYKLGSTSTTWIKLGSNLPNVTVTDMSINYIEDVLYAATFGRGFWSIDIASNVLGVNDFETDLAIDLKLYPVPSNANNVFVKLPRDLDSLDYSIYNYLGSKISSGSVNQNNNKLKTTNLSAGAYIAVFNINGNQTTKRFIIK